MRIHLGVVQLLRFAVIFEMDATSKETGETSHMNEVAVYHVKDGRIVAICDCYQQRTIDTLNEKQQDWKTYQYHQKMLDAENLDAVVVATPAASHYALTKAVLGASKHVFVEKPLAMSTAEADELIERVRAALQ